MRVAAYLRVSTDRQAEKGQGLGVQEQAIRAWAKAHGHRIVAWFRDEGLSGSEGIETRVALANALTSLKDSSAEGLVIYRLDRLARDLILQETLLRDIWAMGAHVFSTDSAEAGNLQNTPDEPSRKLIRQVLGAVAEYERSMIALRMKAGRRRKHERGGFAYGAPGYGYRSEERALVAHVDEQVALGRIVELRAEGRSIRQIIAQLEREGHRPKRGEVWNVGTLSRIVRRLKRNDETAAPTGPRAVRSA